MAETMCTNPTCECPPFLCVAEMTLAPATRQDGAHAPQPFMVRSAPALAGLSSTSATALRR